MRAINESILNKLYESDLNIPEELKAIIDKAEELYWGVSVVDYANGNYLNFSKFSNAGEDFYFEIELRSPEEVVADIKQYAEDFDAIDHAREMDGAPGAPDLKILIKDGEEIKADLEELASTLEAEVSKPIQESLHYTPEDLDEIRKITGPFSSGESGDYRRFSNLPLAALKELADEDLLELRDRQNEGPSIKYILGLEETLQGADITVDGYVIFPPREDQRITVDAITVDLNDCYTPHAEDLMEELGETADEFSEENNIYYMWWD